MNTHGNFKKGIRDGIPIGLGYFVIAFSLGIAMRDAGLNSAQGFFFSAINLASAGEFAAVQVIASNGSYLEIAIITLITNARYLLMSAALSQHISPTTPFIHRLGMAFGITDEIFGINILQETPLQPSYTYGALSVAVPGWAIGTALGILAGNLLPDRIVSALSVALYGMFLAIIIPATKKEKPIAYLVIVSFICSALCQYIPFLSTLAAGTKVIILTILLATIWAIVFPHPTKEVNQ